MKETEGGMMKKTDSTSHQTIPALKAGLKSLHPSSFILHPSLRTLVLAFIIASAGILYLCNISPGVVGIYHDDGIYVVTAKALATGQGYNIISLPHPMPQTKYPIFYPYVLSLIWRIYPSFPANLLPMKLLSILSTILFLIFSYRYLTKFNYASLDLCLGVVALTAWCPWVVYFSGLILSEMPYALLSVIVLYLVERSEAREPGRQKNLSFIIAAAVAAVAYLTRALGLSLIVSAFFYLLYKRRWTPAVVFLFVAIAIITPWLIWTSIHLDGGQLTSQLDTYYASYTRWISFYTGGLLSVKMLNVFIKNLMYCFAGMSTLSNPLFVYVPLPMGIEIRPGLPALLVVAGLLLAGFSVLALIRHLRYRLRLLDFYLIVYLGMTLIWPWPPLRFLVPLAPFILLFHFQTLTWIIETASAMLSRIKNRLLPSPDRDFEPSAWVQRLSTRKIARAVVIVVLSLGVILSLCMTVVSVRDTLAYGIPMPPAIPNPGNATWSGQQGVFHWIEQNLPADAVIAAVHDPMYYLYTGRRSIRGFVVNPLESYYAPRHSLASISSPDEIVQILKGYHITHLILIPNMEPLMIKFVPVLFQKYPGLLTPVYRAHEDVLFIFKVNFNQKAATQKLSRPRLTIRERMKDEG
jgi:hypothetical protein